MLRLQFYHISTILMSYLGDSRQNIYNIQEMLIEFILIHFINLCNSECCYLYYRSLFRPKGSINDNLSKATQKSTIDNYLLCICLVFHLGLVSIK